MPTRPLRGHRKQTRGRNSLHNHNSDQTEFHITATNDSTRRKRKRKEDNKHIRDQTLPVPIENTKTNTERGLPQMNIALLADGRPRITGLNIIKHM